VFLGKGDREKSRQCLEKLIWALKGYTLTTFGSQANPFGRN
jgi:hypothetical protein